MKYSAVWQMVTSRPVLALVAVCALVVTLGECRGHREDNRVLVLPVRAQDTPAAAKMERQPLSPSCPEVTRLVPTAKERKRIEREFGVELGDKLGKPLEATSDQTPAGTPSRPSTAILAIKTIPRLLYGGEGLISLPPGGGEVALTIRPNPRPFLEFRPTYSVGVLAGLRDGSTAGRAYLRGDFLRIGRIHVVSDVGVERFGADQGWYAMAGAELRF